MAFLINCLASIMRNIHINSRFPRICVFLMLLAGLAAVAGCGKSSYYIPYEQAPAAKSPSIKRSQPTKRAQSQPSQRTPARCVPEVVESSLAYVGAPRTITHEVGPLETVWRIARMYDVKREAIYSANGLKPNDLLLIGQKLVVPNARMQRQIINLYRNPLWQYIIVHHTATWEGSARTIHRAHGDRGFWNGLGYHFLIDNGTRGKGDGQIEMSPRWIRQQVGAHCKAGGMNDRAVGVALVGNFNSGPPTANQLQSLEYLLNTLSKYYRIPPSNILGHGEVEGAKTECPGRLLPLQSFRQSAGKRR